MTEEIPIDTSQFMDAMASSNNEISIDNTQTVNSVTDSGNERMKDTTDDVESRASKVKAELSESNATLVMPAVTENSDADKHSKTSAIVTSQIRKKDKNADANITSSEPSTPIEYETAHPNVMVVDPLSDSVMSMLYSERKKAGARRGASKVKGRLLEIPTCSLQKISSGQVVHVPIIKTDKTDRCIHVVRMEIATEKRTHKNDGSKDDKHETVTDVNREADSILEEQIESNKDSVKDGNSETDICQENQDGNKMKLPVTTEIGDKPSGTGTSEISAIMTEGVEVLDKYNSHQRVDASDTNLAQTISTALGHKVEIIKVPLETKSHADEEKHIASETVIVQKEMNSIETTTGMMSPRETHESETMIQIECSENMSEVIPTDSVHTVVELAENQESGIASPGRENIEFVNMATDIAEPYTVEVSDRVENGDKILVNCDTSFSKADSINQNDNTKAIQTSLCEVIEYDGKRKAVLPQPGSTLSPFDYVVLGDNLIEIRKPQPLHGRIQQPKQEDTGPDSGNVGFVVINEPKGSKPTTCKYSKSSYNQSRLQQI